MQDWTCSPRNVVRTSAQVGLGLLSTFVSKSRCRATLVLPSWASLFSYDDQLDAFRPQQLDTVRRDDEPVCWDPTVGLPRFQENINCLEAILV